MINDKNTRMLFEQLNKKLKEKIPVLLDMERSEIISFIIKIIIENENFKEDLIFELNNLLDYTQTKINEQ